MILLLACQTKDDASPPEETGTETGLETAEHSVVESADASETQHSDTTGDTEGETQEETDTGVKPADWSPGDDIPGWDDADCTETAGSQALETQFPTMWSYEGTFGDLDAVSGPHWSQLVVRDCVWFVCSVDTSYGESAYALAQLDATAATDDASRGIGWWGPDETTPRALVATGKGPLEQWTNGAITLGDPTPASATLCLSRVRPDEVAGVLRVEIALARSAAAYHTLYDTMILRFPFRFTFEDHAGYDPNFPDVPADKPDTFDFFHFTYEAGYDAAWPWDEITDPGIREAVYRRYSPYNAP